jgi:hypothetical protein
VHYAVVDNFDIPAFSVILDCPYSYLKNLNALPYLMFCVLYAVMFIPQALGLWASFIVRDSKQLENTTFGKLDLFPCSGKGRGILC